jgi:hypothetical protein
MAAVIGSGMFRRIRPLTSERTTELLTAEAALSTAAPSRATRPLAVSRDPTQAERAEPVGTKRARFPMNESSTTSQTPTAFRINRRVVHLKVVVQP